MDKCPPLGSGILCHHNFEYNRKDLATYPIVHTLIENYNKMIWQCSQVNLGQNAGHTSLLMTIANRSNIRELLQNIIGKTEPQQSNA